MPTNDRCSKIIVDLVSAINEMLAQVTKGLAEASDYIQNGESQNAVVGTLMAIETPLEQVQSLYKSIIAIHRLPKQRT
jgi:hypothetical protein